MLIKSSRLLDFTEFVPSKIFIPTFCSKRELHLKRIFLFRRIKFKLSQFIYYIKPSIKLFQFGKKVKEIKVDGFGLKVILLNIKFLWRFYWIINLLFYEWLMISRRGELTVGMKQISLKKQILGILLFLMNSNLVILFRFVKALCDNHLMSIAIKPNYILLLTLTKDLRE